MRSIYKTVDGRLVASPSLEKGCWVHLQNPTREEMDALTNLFALDPTFLPAALDMEETARLEQGENRTLLIVDAPYMENDAAGHEYSTFPIGIVLAGDVIITVAARETPVITDFIQERVRGFSTADRQRFILHLLYRNAAVFLSYLKQVDRSSMQVQEKLARSLRNRELLQMMKLGKSLVFFSTSLKGNEVVLEKMMRLQSLRQTPQDSDLLDDVIVENRQALEMCAIYRDILSGTMDAYASVISNNLNIAMKVLTSLTVLLTVPSLFASLWGMNVAVPFSDSPWGFYVILAMAVASSFLAFLVLWRKKMF